MTGTALVSTGVSRGESLRSVPTWRFWPPSGARKECTVCRGTGWELVAEAGASVARRCACSLLDRAVRLREGLGIPARYEHCRLSIFEPRNFSQHRALDECRRIAERYPMLSRDLFLAGPPGVGKTHLVVGVLRDLLDRFHENILFADFETVLRAGSDDRGREWSRLSHAALLVLDSFGSGSITARAVGRLAQLLELRLGSGRRRTIYTGEPVQWYSLADGNRIDRHVSDADHWLRALPPRLLMSLQRQTRMLRILGTDFRTKGSEKRLLP